MFRAADRMHCSVMDAAAAPKFWQEAALMALSAENGAANEKQRQAERQQRAKRRMGGR